MYKVGIYLRVRKACFVEGMSVREAARVFGLHRDTVRKMLEYSVPPGYRRQRRARRPKLDPYKGVMDQILEQDLSSPKKQLYVVKTSGTKGEPLKRATWTLTGSGSSQICQPPFG